MRRPQPGLMLSHRYVPQGWWRRSSSSSSPPEKRAAQSAHGGGSLRLCGLTGLSNLAIKCGFCPTLGDWRKSAPESAARATGEGRQAVATRCYRAAIGPSSGRPGKFRTAFTKKATEPKCATYRWSNDGRKSSPTRLSIAQEPHRHRANEDLVARFICHANSTHVLQSLWRDLDYHDGGRCSSTSAGAGPDVPVQRASSGTGAANSGGVSEGRDGDRQHKHRYPNNHNQESLHLSSLPRTLPAYLLSWNLLVELP
jgi:hypothetical protein